MENQTRSLSEVAGLMGVSERTVRRWIKAGRLKAYKPGRDYRIPEAGFRAFIEESEISPKAEAPHSPPPEEERRRAGAWADLFESGLRVASEYVHTHLRGPATIIPVGVALDVQRMQASLGRVMESEGGWERLAPLEAVQDREADRLYRASERLHDLVGIAHRLAHPSPEEEEKLQRELTDLREGLAKTESGAPRGA